MEQTTNQSSSQQGEESIFDEAEFSIQGYDKHVKNARNAIFVVAITQLLFGLLVTLSTSKHMDSMILEIRLGVIVLISTIFFVLGLWTKKKPYTAILSALIFYGILILNDTIYEPMSLFKGIIVKIFIIIYLVRGLRDARDAQRWKEALGK
ncbi:MAG TPA: hypothetical protein VNV85_09520 [Puia sp.]|jgi:hypothetical protein|nr:hypothetical protein [Puia sp.]